MIYLVGILTAFADQLIKNIISNNFYAGQSLPVVKDIFHLTYVKNTGGVFGILQGYSKIFTIASVAAIVICIMIVNRLKIGNPFYKLAWGLILGGAVGNLIDRLRFGYVVDYLDFRIWPVFNLADSAIVAGGALLVLYLLSGEEISG